MENKEYKEKLVFINRITKVVKGGRRFAFSALVVVGNQSGKLGIAHAKAKQVPDAVKKATEMAMRKQVHIPLRDGRTLHHDVYGKEGSGKVLLRSAPKGTGIIAGGAMRAVFECVGIRNILAKSYGSRNPINLVRATINALDSMRSPQRVAKRRGISVSKIFT